MYSKMQKRALLPPEGRMRAHALVVDHDDLAGLDVAHEVGADDVERAGLAGQHIARPASPPRQLAEHQRPHAERVARADQRAVVQRHQAVGALHLLQRVDQPVHHGGVQADGDEVDEHLGIRGGLEQAAAPHQRALQHVGVGQVAVVRDGEAAELEIGIQRLDVAQRRLAGGGVAVVAERGAAGQAGDHRARRRNCRRPGRGPCGRGTCRCRSSRETMPAASCPRCCSACRPSAVSAAASALPQTPTTPHSSCGLVVVTRMSQGGSRDRPCASFRSGCARGAQQLVHARVLRPVPRRQQARAGTRAAVAPPASAAPSAASGRLRACRTGSGQRSGGQHQCRPRYRQARRRRHPAPGRRPAPARGPPRRAPSAAPAARPSGRSDFRMISTTRNTRADREAGGEPGAARHAAEQRAAMAGSRDAGGRSRRPRRRCPAPRAPGRGKRRAPPRAASTARTTPSTQVIGGGV